MSDSSYQNGVCLLSGLSFTAHNISFGPCSSWKRCCAATQAPYFLLLNSQMGKHVMHSWELHWELYLLHMLRWANKGFTDNLQLLLHQLLGVCFHTFLFWFRYLIVIYLLLHGTSFSTVRDSLCSYSWLNGHTLHLTAHLKKASENLPLHIWVCIINRNFACKSRAGNLMLEYNQRVKRLQKGTPGWKTPSMQHARRWELSQ